MTGARLSAETNTASSSTLVSNVYTFSPIGQRLKHAQSGTMYAYYGTGLTTTYGYDLAGELTSAATTVTGTTTAVLGVFSKVWGGGQLVDFGIG